MSNQGESTAALNGFDRDVAARQITDSQPSVKRAELLAMATESPQHASIFSADFILILGAVLGILYLVAGLVIP
jgi:hypothetical protein